MVPTSTSRRNAANTAGNPDTTALSREAIVDHALAMADQEGLDAVSIRRIAQDFGVTPMALYWHVKNKDELLAAMGDRMLESLVLPIDGGRHDLEQLRDLMTLLVGALSAHPGSTGLAQVRVLQCETGQLLAERALDTLRLSGFSVEQSANLARACLQTAIMLVSGRPGAETRTPQDERAAVLAGKQAALAGLPRDRFPHLVECAAALTDCDDEISYYQGGIELFIAGVQALQRRLPDPRAAAAG
jgi:TetR/AcrR family tetracycline transcriptional repressor